jgi:hypothetical protein
VKVSTCSSCAARVIWVLSNKGNPVMVNAEPEDDGDHWLVKGTGAPPVAVKAAEEVKHAALYKVHFATCPNAEAHRKRKS